MRRMALVEIEKDGAVAVLTLNRPEAMNALSRALRDAIAQAVNAASADEEIRAIVITGAGERAFTAGVDLKELANTDLKGAADLPPALDPAEAMAACPKPIIGAINGVAVTGGFELALACDILIASTNARFADTHIRVGILPGWGLSQRLSRLIGISRAKEMSLTGNYIDAETALAWGLVNRVTTPEELMPAARKLAQDIASCDPKAARRYKAMIDGGFALPFGEAMAFEKAASDDWMRGVDTSDIGARREGILARGRGQNV
jgi:enoyl-CoA hydratase